MQRTKSACWTTMRSCNTLLAMYVALVPRDGCRLCVGCAFSGEAVGSGGVEPVCNPGCSGVDWASLGSSIDHPHLAAFFLSGDWRLLHMVVSSFFAACRFSSLRPPVARPPS